MADPGVRKSILTYVTIWIGQIVSLFGSGLARFGLAVFIFQETGSVTQFGLSALSGILPGTLLSPIAGAYVDRWDRKTVLIVSDLVTAVGSAVLLLLAWNDGLQVWHIYIVAAVNSASSAFQFPAFAATTPLLVPKKHLPRASGLVQSANAMVQILAPLLAAALLMKIELKGLLMIDLCTFAAAVTALLMVRIPRPERSAASAKAAGKITSEVGAGWRFIKERPGLLALLFVFAGVNFANGAVQVLLTPLVLSFATATSLSHVLAIGTAGMFLGGLVMGAWGGPRKKINGVFIFLAVGAAILFLGGFEPSIPLIAFAAFVYLGVIPIVFGCSQAIWQRKVEPDLQGRVFAIRRTIATASMPIAYMLTGPLADYVFEPAMRDGGSLAGSIGSLIGTGPGRGIGLMFILLGAFILMVLGIAFTSARLRNHEAEVADAVGDLPLGARRAGAGGGNLSPMG